jgi:hypothetical protein
MRAVIVRNIQSMVVDGGASTAPDHVEAFSINVSKLSAATDGYRLAIHGSLESAGTALTADPVSVCVSRFKGVRSLGHGHVPSL